MDLLWNTHGQHCKIMYEGPGLAARARSQAQGPADSTGPGEQDPALGPGYGPGPMAHDFNMYTIFLNYVQTVFIFVHMISFWFTYYFHMISINVIQGILDQFSICVSDSSREGLGFVAETIKFRLQPATSNHSMTQMQRPLTTSGHFKSLQATSNL